jgi:UbiD family decarboxylase
LACSPPSLGAKLGTVVDEDIDVFDPSQAEWAVNTGPDRPFRAVPTGTLP